VTAQPRLRIWLLRRMDQLGLTKTQVAAAMDRDESAVRRMLSEHSDIRIDFERHLLPLMNLLQLTPCELVQLYATAHGLAVDVVPQALPFDEDEPTLVSIAKMSAAMGKLNGLAAQAHVDGQLSTARAAEVVETGAQTARLVRTVAARVVRRAR
jgi:hypothetical protein